MFRSDEDFDSQEVLQKRQEIKCRVELDKSKIIAF